MNKRILNTGVQTFINNNQDTDIMSVLLKKPIFEGISQKELAEQLEAKKKCKKKLPTWFETPKIYYPKKLNIEQSSSEKTATYKSQIVDGKSLLDLTGGFGVDSYFFSKKIDTVHYTEIDKELTKIASYNFTVLGVKNINVKFENGISFLKETRRTFDWIYLDPSRRNDVETRVFKLADCSPNIIDYSVLFFEKSEHILIKVAPLLDISSVLKELPNIKTIHVVALNNEVKELLLELKKEHIGHPSIKTINIKNKENELFNFEYNAEKNAVSRFSEPAGYLYEPNAAILKSGAFKLIGERYGIHKLHRHSHLFTSDRLIEFPGRRFRIDTVVSYGRNGLKSLNVEKCNVTIRNFPESVDLIRKKFRLKTGGDIYLFFTKNHTDQLIIIKGFRIG